MIDFVIRSVPDGCLPIITKDGKEVYRGKVEETAIYALAVCDAALMLMLERGEI